MRASHVVDVIVPTRNRLGLLMEAIDSIRRQTFQAWRLIVVDDASDDGSVKEIVRLAANDPRIDIVLRSEAGGPQAARQSGFEKSVAPFVAPLDSDDLWQPQKLEKQLELFETEVGSLQRLGAVLCWHQWTDMDGRPRGPVRRPSAHGLANPLVSTNMSSIMIRREALEAAGGFLPSATRSLYTCEGIEFYIRLTEHAEFAVVPETLVRCRHHSGARANRTHADGTDAEELAYVLDLHAARLSAYPEDLGRLRARLGARYLAAGRRRQGIGALTSAAWDAGPRDGFRLLREYGPFAVRASVAGSGGLHRPTATNNGDSST